MTPGAIEVVDYDPRWPLHFERLAARVRGSVPSSILVAIEHVGSTAVCGLAAKPVIDLDVVMTSARALPEVIASLASLGYVHEGDAGIAGRDAFRWPPGEPRHHLYVCAADNEELARHVAFRDYLRAHQGAAAEYAALKYALAEQFRNDRSAYSRAKTAFILETLRAAGVS